MSDNTHLGALVIDLKNQKISAIDAAHSWADHVGQKVKHQFFLSFKESAQSCALLAVGGFGHGLMAPYSDIDLCIITPNDPKIYASEIRHFLCALWDYGFKLGPQIGTYKEIYDLCEHDLQVRTAFLERRFLVGNIHLFQNFSHDFKVLQAKTQREFIDHKIKERDMRLKKSTQKARDKWDIKNQAGSLRDINFMRWLHIYMYPDQELILPPDIFKAYEALWCLRFLFQYERKNAGDILNNSWQVHMAPLFGMKDYVLFQKLYGTYFYKIDAFTQNVQEKWRASLTFFNNFTHKLITP